MTTYYDRSAQTYIDGSPIFRTDEDETNERLVADEIERWWRCRVHPFSPLAEVDYWIERAHRPVGIAELKSRSFASDYRETVFLNCRKHNKLRCDTRDYNLPAVFVVKFTDVTKWILVDDIDPSKVAIGGTTHIVKARSDREMVIHVPIDTMRPIQDGPWTFDEDGFSL